MNTNRTPELDDSEEANLSTSEKLLAEQLANAKVGMHDALQQAMQPQATHPDCYRLLVVDDTKIFLDMVIPAADTLNKKHQSNLVVETLNPKNVDDARNRIIEAFNNKKPFDYVLLDFSYVHTNFTGLDILATLRPDDKPLLPLAGQGTEAIHLFYLPVAIVTRGGSAENIDQYFEEKALGAGADKVYLEKGFTSQTNESGLTPEPLLEALLKGGFKEMRFRAWARLWQNLREQLEDCIKQQLDANKWMKTSLIDEALAEVWNILEIPLKQSGYASHITMRILKPDKRGKPYWHLHKVGSSDNSVHCPAVIPWDAVPILATCLTEKPPIIHSPEALQETDLFPNTKDRKFPEFSHYLDRSAMVARIDTKNSPAGTFFITREPGLPPFFNEDQANLRIIVERLGLFHRELTMRWRNHHRQLGLVKLGKDLLEIAQEDTDQSNGEIAEDIIVAKAVKVLHFHLHRLRNIFTEDENKNPALTGRVSIRLIEPGTGCLVRPDQRNWQAETNQNKTHVPRWALGFDTKDSEPKKFTIDNDARYQTLLEEGQPKFLSSKTLKPKDVDENRRNKTRTKMLAPIKAGNVVVGAIDVEHQFENFYGESENASAYYTLLQAVALEVGHALLSLRARRMQRKLLQLLTITGQDKQDTVITKLMEVLFNYTACAVGMWLEPDGDDWKIGNVWECPQDYDKDKPAPTRFAIDRKKQTNRLEQWRRHIRDDFGKTLIRKVVKGELADNDQELVFYHEEGFASDERLGIKTRSQAVLALRDPDTKEWLGVFSLLFNQIPGLDEKRQKPLLREAARFAANYLSIQRKNREYWMNSQIMQQQAQLGSAYQQLRHSLKLQIGGANGAIDMLLKELEKSHLQSNNIDKQTNIIKQFFSNFSKDIDVSRALLDPPKLGKVDLRSEWQAVREQLASYANEHHVYIEELTETLKVYADSEIVKIVFTNLIDNAIEAMITAGVSKRHITCKLLLNPQPDKCQIAVRNTGTAIPPSIASRLFKENGISSKPTGTGFGTYFSAFLLARSGASIEYDSSYQQGAQFNLTFPLQGETDVSNF